MKKMKKSIKKQWLKALRSGEYKQGEEYLRDSNNNFCCLGVLCNLHAMAHPKIAAKQTFPEFYLGGNQCLPKQVQKWSGIDSDDGYMVGLGDSLASMNDNGKSFEELADIIEKHF